MLAACLSVHRTALGQRMPFGQPCSTNNASAALQIGNLRRNCLSISSLQCDSPRALAISKSHGPPDALPRPAPSAIFSTVALKHDGVSVRQCLGPLVKPVSPLIGFDAAQISAELRICACCSRCALVRRTQSLGPRPQSTELPPDGSCKRRTNPCDRRSPTLWRD